MTQQFNYGGQAVLEGVMMRGSRRMAVAVRAPDHKIILHDEAIDSPLYSGLLSRIPFVRGLGLLWDSLGLGTRALMFSARVTAGDEAASLSDPVAAGTLVVSLLFAVGIFFVAPLLVADGFEWLVSGIGPTVPAISWLSSPLSHDLIEGFVRLLLVVGYIWAIGQIPDVARMFAYHGAEHKAINAYEAGAVLTPEEVSRYPLVHPRCGTGFLLIVVVASILAFALIGNPPFILRYLARIVLIPVIATVAYEYMRLTAQNMDKSWIRALVTPQLALQRLTTREPSIDMLEVSIAALKRVLESEPAAVPTTGAATAEAN